MVYNYLKLGLRNLFKHKTYSLINIIGLSVGIAAFLLIFLHVQYELGFNKHIPENSRLYRCVEVQTAPGVGEQHVAVTMGPLGSALKKDFPEVEDFVRLMYWGPRSIEYEGKYFEPEFIVFADPSVFNLFGIKLILGDTATALKEMNSLVISKEIAENIFGSAEKAMGSLVKINNKDSFTVTGVIENQPAQASFRINGLMPMAFVEKYVTSWHNNSLDTYVRLKEGTDVKQLEAKFPDFIKQYSDPEEGTEYGWSLYLQPLMDIHLKSGHIKFQIMNYNQGSWNMIIVFSIIAMMIILLACINFINLAIARSVKRSREVGMRKVMGANKSNLIYQFLGESLIITFISIALALLLVELLLPFFNSMLGNEFKIDFLGNPVFNIGLFIILVLVSLIAGSYPAFYLSRYEPIKVLRSGAGSEIGSGWLTKSLVIFQFVISIGMIFSIAVTYDQFKYAINKDLGINYTDVVSIRLKDRNEPETVQYLKNEFLTNSNVLDVAFVSDINGVSGSQGAIEVDDSISKSITVRYGYVDYNYFKMMGVPIVKGRDFNRENALDEKEAIILNQAAVDYLGWDDPIGKTFRPFDDSLIKRKVIGVIADYNYYSIHQKIEPAIYFINTDQSYVLAVKINHLNQKETLENLENIWNSRFPGVPFSYKMAEDIIHKNYQDEKNTLQLFSFFTILSLVVSCLGLYGLTALMIERKTKEIGIRKVFGGSVSQIVTYLLKSFVVLILIAGIIATPIAWYIMSEALTNFAYSISISWFYFLESISVALVVALLTITFHAVKAANSNPVDSLRYE